MTKEFHPSKNWSRNRFLSVVMGVIGLLFSSTMLFAQSNEYVVVSIKGTFTGLALGQVLSEGDRIEIPEGVEVKLISKTGESLALQGAIAATVTNEVDDKAGETALRKVSASLFDNNEFVSVMGGTRTLENSADINAQFPNGEKYDAWSPELSQVTDYCLRLQAPIFRRTAASDMLSIVLKHGTRAQKKITWSANSSILNLKEHIQMPQMDISVKVSGRSNPISIHVMDAKGTSTLEQTVWMAERNCQNQALQLLAEQ